MRILLLLSLLPLTSFCQLIKLDPETKHHVATEVIQVDSVSKDDLFIRAKEWVAMTYRSANDVIQFADKEQGKIICKGYFSITHMLYQRLIRHTLLLEFKDGRFRYTYTDFAYSTPAADNRSESSFDRKAISTRNVLEKTEERIKENIDSLVKSVRTKSSTKDF